MPKFGELIATDVWAAAARTLSDISAEEIFDLPVADTVYATGAVQNSGTANTFGAWTELIADVGAGKRLIWALMSIGGATSFDYEVEFGEGTSGSEAAIARFDGYNAVESGVGWRPPLLTYLWKALTDNARLSVRVKRSAGGAGTHYMVAGVV